MLYGDLVAVSFAVKECHFSEISSLTISLCMCGVNRVCMRFLLFHKTSTLLQLALHNSSDNL